MSSNNEIENFCTEDFLETIFNTATESWVLTNSLGNIVKINPITESMFGYKAEELLGQKIEVLMPSKERKAHVPLRNGYIQKPRKRPHGIGVEVLGLRKNNTEFPVEISLNYYKTEKEVYGLAVIIDISLRKEIERKLREAVLEKEQLKREKIEAELQVLKNQVSPHYFFNCLSVLVPLIDIDPERSKDYIEKLAKTYRYILEIRDRFTVTVAEELDFIKDYEFLQSVRFKDKFSIIYDVDHDDLMKNILPFSIQILIENVFKHNAFYKDNKIIIEISSIDKGIQISNNIVKRIDSKIESFGLGLKNIKKQYEHLTDIKPRFHIENDLYKAWIPFVRE